MQAIHPVEHAWLKTFFSAPNTIGWNDVSRDELASPWLEQIQPWICNFVEKGGDAPIVLPVLRADGETFWYAAALSDSDAVALSAELQAAVGASYSNFAAQPLEIDRSDPIESALYDRFGRRVFRFAATSPDRQPQILIALSQYLSALRRRPPIPDRNRQPFGQLRGDFDRALLAGNEGTATVLLEAMCATGRVNAEQRQFLEIRLLSGLGRQEEIARNFTLLRAIAELPLPPQTIVDIVDALYRTHITDIEDSDPTSVVSAFKERIADAFGPLFKERKGIRHPNVLKAFLLFELCSMKPNAARCEGILAAYPTSSPGSQLLQRWWQHFAAPSTLQTSSGDTLGAVRQAMADEDYEVGIKLCMQALPNPWAYSALLRCAAEVGDPTVGSEILTLINAADEQVRSLFTDRDRSRIEKLKNLKPSEAVSAGQSWLFWARNVSSGAYESSPLALLKDCVVRWNVEDYLFDLATCKGLAEVISNAPVAAEHIFRDAYPYLVEFFVSRVERPVRGLVPLYSILIKMIAWNGAASADELALTADVLEAFVSLGPTREDYVETVSDLGEILQANRAAMHVDWALNSAEILALQSSPEEEVRLRFFMSVIDLVRANVHRVTEAQRLVLRMLAQDYACLAILDTLPEREEVVDSENDCSKFAGLVGIYTLTESAGQRAKQVLEKVLPLARIELNADHAATDRLRHLAANSDIFVFAWRSSKHQAYYCAKEARGQRDMQLPPGKGCASILDSVFKELAHR
ncbi:protein DpdD [Paraburkholderia sediminicola]|uniref:protein DpdD n=1 Tax=Paraburkholderia sediminicola TaxID=458836 RepID=UPI0038B9E1FC